MRIRLDRLENVVRANELPTQRRFNMRDTFQQTNEEDEIDSCGTACCLIGNYNIMVDRVHTTFGADYSKFKFHDWLHFGISQEEYYWLFAEGAHVANPHIHYPDNKPRFATDWVISHNSLSNVTKEEALSRLKKFIAYKRRKQLFIYDRHGVTELARRSEGDHNFVTLAKQVAV